MNDNSRNTKMLSFESLVLAIEELESNGVISFEDFKLLPYKVIQKMFFAMPNPTMMQKAIIKIEDIRSGRKEPSSHVSVTEYYENGKLDRTKKRTSYF